MSETIALGIENFEFKPVRAMKVQLESQFWMILKGSFVSQTILSFRYLILIAVMKTPSNIAKKSRNLKKLNNLELRLHLSIIF